MIKNVASNIQRFDVGSFGPDYYIELSNGAIKIWGYRTDGKRIKLIYDSPNSDIKYMKVY